KRADPPDHSGSSKRAKGSDCVELMRHYGFDRVVEKIRRPIVRCVCTATGQANVAVAYALARFTASVSICESASVTGLLKAALYRRGSDVSGLPRPAHRRNLRPTKPVIGRMSDKSH